MYRSKRYGKTLKKVIFLLWTVSVYLLLEHLGVDITVDYQHKNGSAITKREEATDVVKKKRINNHQDLQLSDTASQICVDVTSKNGKTDQNLYTECSHFVQHRTPSQGRMQYLNSISFPQDLVQEMQSTILLMLKILLNGIKKVIFFDISKIENKGDPAISYGELEIFSKLDVEVLCYSCYYMSTDIFYDAAKKISGYNKSEVAVLSSGGGNVGLYEHHDYQRSKMLEIFHDYKFLLLPQSVWFGGYTPNQNNIANLQKVKASYENHPDASMLLRYQWSYDYCKKHFPTSKVYLVPDMAFGAGNFFTQFVHLPLYDIVWIQRVDMEKPGGVDAVIPSNISCIQQDWDVGWQSPIGANLIDWTYMMVQNAALFLLRGKVVITDRLHGLILAKFLNLPVVVIDNKIKKLSHFANTWCWGLSNYQWAESREEALNKALKLLKHNWK